MSPLSRQKLSNTSELLIKISALIAQSVEQRIENPRVPGSTPGRGTIYRSSIILLLANNFKSYFGAKSI